MRIAHVTATFPPYRAGTGNVCLHNARELAQRGHDVHVFTALVVGAPPLERSDGITIHRLRPLMRVGNAPLLPGLLTALHAFDVIHLHYPFFGGELTTLAAISRRVPLVVTYHQDVFLSGAMGAIERVLRYTVGRATLRAAARILFTSRDYGRASYVQPFLKGREHQIGELPNGVDVQTFTPAPATEALQRRHCIGPDDRVALLVAGLDRAHAFKGVHNFIGALALLPTNYKGVIVGDGDLRAAYTARAQSLGIADRVVFAGRVADADLPDYYRLAHVTVLPSTTMGEAFGLVLVESLASGVPVIATNLPGVRTVVDHGIDGLLVPPNDIDALTDAIQAILRDPPRGHAMGVRGRAKVEQRYDWRSIGAQLEAVYHQVRRTSVPSEKFVRGES